MKRTLRVIGILIVVVLIVAVALPFLINANQFRPRLESELSLRLGRAATLGDLKLSLLSGGVTASDIAIADDPKFGHAPFLTAQSLAVGVDMGALIFSRKLNVTGVTIAQPGISLLQDPAGKWNFSSLGATGTNATPRTSGESGASNLNLSVQLIKITDGKLVLSKTTGTTRPEVLDKVNIQIQDLSTTSAFPFSLTASATGGAQIKLDGSFGPLNPADTAMTPFSASLQITHLDLAHAGFLPPTSFAGLVSLDGKVDSKGQTATVTGTVKAEQLVLAKGGAPAKEPVTFEFALDQDLQKHAGTLRRGNVHIGTASASLTGTYHTEGENTIVNAHLLAPGMAVPELEAMLPSLNIVLPQGSSLQGGLAKIDVNASGPSDRLVLDGSAGVTNTRLAGFSLGSKIALVTKLAGMSGGPNTEIQNFSSNVHFDTQGLRADNISLIAPEVGEVNGSGLVSAAQALDFKMTAKIHAGGLLAALGSNTTVPFHIGGTSAQPKFEPDMKAVVADKLKVLEGGKAGKEVQGVIKGLFGGKKN